MIAPQSNVPVNPLKAVLFIGLSLSIGWGIRGNYGHEWGASLPGALAAMACVLISGRTDWMHRVGWFGMLGAIGWALGGSMAYMVAIAYTHSGHGPSAIFGFYALAVVGFLWAYVGGIGCALPAYLTSDRLRQFFAPLSLIFVLWWADGVIEDHLFIDGKNPLDWFDVNWVSTTLAIIGVLICAAWRRKLEWAHKLILSMAFGWWIGFVVLRVLLHLSMLPGKSENWAGSVGLAIGASLFLYRSGPRDVLRPALVTGIAGGIAFPAGVLFKLIEMKSGWHTNWHSILEQSYGLMNGVGLALAMLPVMRTAPRSEELSPTPGRDTAFCTAFLLLLLTYLNMYKQVEDWVSAKAVAKHLWIVSAYAWFDLFYALTAITFLLLLARHLRRPLSLIPTTPAGKSQMLYLALLWWMIIANFMKSLPAFAAVRLVTEGTIFFNGLLCTLMMSLWFELRDGAQNSPDRPTRRGIVAAALALLLWPGICFSGVRAMYGSRFTGEAGHHYRFGPKAVPAQE